MKEMLTNLIKKTKETVEETLENASEDIKEVVDAVTEDAGKLMSQAKAKLGETKEQMKEELGEPDDLLGKAKKTFVEASEKIKAAAREEWESVEEKVEELKSSLSNKKKDGGSDIAPDGGKA